MVNVRLLADLPDALDSAAANTFLYKTAGGMEFQTLEYSDIVGYPTTGIDSAGIISLIDASYLATRDSSSHLDVTNYLDSGVSTNIKADSAGTTLKIGNYSKPISNLYLDSASTITIGSHSFSLANNGEVSFFGGSASSYGVSSGSSSAVAVENASYTTFLLKTDSTQTDAQVDASTNTLTVTESGNVKSTALSPYHPKGYSTRHTAATSRYYTEHLTGSADFDLNGNDWSYEGWVYVDESHTLGSYTRAFGIGPNWNNSKTFQVLMTDADHSGYMTVGWSDGGGLGRKLISSTTFEKGQWNHIAVCKSGNSIAYFYNGTRIASNDSYTEEVSAGNSYAFVGHTGTNTEGFVGYSRDIRLVNGSSAYDASASSITVPTEPLTAITNTKLLVTGPFLADKSSSTHSFTTSGMETSCLSPYDHGAYSPSSHGGSVYFDGSGDYINTGTTAGMDFGSGDFTFEFWINQSSYSSGRVVADGRSVWNDNGWSIETKNNGIWFYSSGAEVLTTSGTNFSTEIDRWIHVAIVRNSGTITTYINGVSEGSVSYSSDINTTLSTVQIGRRQDNDGAYDLVGYLADFRIVSSAVYTANFTPPTEPLTAIANTELLTCTNKNSLWDAAAGSLLTTNGTAAASTTQTKYASSSVYFDTSSSSATNYLVGEVDAGFGTGDFTIEFWFWPNSLDTSYAGSNGTILDLDASASVDTSWWVIHQVNNKLTFASNSAEILSSSTGQFTAQNWSHAAIVRNSGTLTWYINGTAAGNTSYSTTLGTKRDLYIGVQPGQSRWFKGYLEDIRITKGLARYTSAFTPPTSSLTA